MTSIRRTKSVGVLPEVKYGYARATPYSDIAYRYAPSHVYAMRRSASVSHLPSVQKPYLGWKYTGTPSDRFCRDWLLWDNNYLSRLRPDTDPDYVAGSRYSHLYPPSSLWTYYPGLDRYARNSRYAFADRHDPLYWSHKVAAGGGGLSDPPVTYPYRASWVQESLDTERSLERYKRGLVGLDVHLQHYWLTPNTWKYRFSNYLPPYNPPISYTPVRHYRYGSDYN